MMIFKVTDKNKVVGLNPNTFEIWQKTISKEDADFYRKKIDEEIIPRIYFSQMPGEVIGTLVIATPITSINDDI